MSGDLASNRVRGLVEADPIVLLEIAGAVAAEGRFPSDGVTRVAQDHAVRLPDADHGRLRATVELMLLGHDVDTALEWLHCTGILRQLFPELEATVDLVQEAGRQHKDVWDHTKQVVKQTVRRPLVRWAALLHDIGKVPTRVLLPDGRVTFHRHAEVGARMFDPVARRLGFDKPDNVHIKNISHGMGGEAIVEAQFDAAFRFTADKEGKWQAVDVRAGDRKWESIELIQTALRKEKALRTGAELRAIATALEAYRRDKGSYVQAETGSALIDHLAPNYLSSIIRLDAWSRELNYKGSSNSYRLSSLGPDGKADTDDDIVFENGRLVKGAIE